tara:strand:- start:504 stop:698 length:195 start_codon:yes stop_codon:yes gene_type:complete
MPPTTFMATRTEFAFNILVIALCAPSALFIDLTAQQSERLESYAQRQLESVAQTTEQPLAQTPE